MDMTEFFFAYVWPFIIILAECLLLLVFLLVAVAYVIYADRKIWAAVQMRRGPNVVGPWGLFQSFADMLKFALKEPVIPAGANKGVFLLAPLVSTVLALAAWAVIPVNAGWALAETNRPPFDLVEAESEIVAGFMVEYGSTPYVLFMLGEYVAICTMCAMGTIFFLGGWLSPIPYPPFTWVPGVIWFVLKASMLFFMFAMVKSIVPRYRYDQLMRLGWKVFLPLSLAMVVIVAAVLQYGVAAPK